MAKIREDLRCFDCAKKEAEYLFFWKKYLKEIGKEAYYSPKILCNDCMRKFTGPEMLFEDCPVFISFDKIGTMDVKYLGWLLSKKGKEMNCLNNKYWRKKLWRIRAIYSNGAKNK